MFVEQRKDGCGLCCDLVHFTGNNTWKLEILDKFCQRLISNSHHFKSSVALLPSLSIVKHGSFM